ncbi:hypothetical protein F5Y16DRAFT_402526 [Xylariaceae sp. FL0255]|nr:hypothetical protein F5Y16DRAFT_402526 [Xylariaceae sp. FL0255]
MANDSDECKAVAAWNNFAAACTEESETKEASQGIVLAKLRKDHPELFISAIERQPNPIQFFGPGPDGTYDGQPAPVGMLHYARYRYELGGCDDPDGAGYYHEDNPKKDNGLHCRPTYHNKHDPYPKEVNPFRWHLFPAYWLWIQPLKFYPGPGSSKNDHGIYLLNDNDFNETDHKRPSMELDLDNRQQESLDKLYPLGHQLLKRLSVQDNQKRVVYPEWAEGQCLGPNPDDPDALRVHLGWFPKRLRGRLVGIGGDPTDAIAKEVFHGNLDVEPKTEFVAPKKSFRENPKKILTFVSSEHPNKTFKVVSRARLQASFGHPEPDSIDNRNAWLAARGRKLIKPKDSGDTDSQTDLEATAEENTEKEDSILDLSSEMEKTNISEDSSATDHSANTADVTVKSGESKGGDDEKEGDGVESQRKRVRLNFRSRFLGKDCYHYIDVGTT